MNSVLRSEGENHSRQSTKFFVDAPGYNQVININKLISIHFNGF